MLAAVTLTQSARAHAAELVELHGRHVPIVPHENQSPLVPSDVGLDRGALKARGRCHG
jgi:arylamine N-acetyltransferase